MTPEKRAQLVERIRVACFEAPKAHSASEWERRIEAILDEAAEPEPDVITTTTLDGRVVDVSVQTRYQPHPDGYHYTGGAGPEWRTWHEHDELGHRHRGGEKPHGHSVGQRPHPLFCDCVFCE